MRTFGLLLPYLAIAGCAGCSRPQPTLSGGKPDSHWVETLRSSPDAKLRKEAAFKLGNVGPSDPTELPALGEALKDRDAVVRCEAILAIVKFGSAARGIIPALEELRDRDRDVKVRGYPEKAVGRIRAEP